MIALADSGYEAGMGYQVTDVQSALRGADYPADGTVEGPSEVMHELRDHLGAES